MTPEDRAKRSAQAMWADDNASPWFGMDLIEVTEGQAVMQLTVQPHHCNGHGMCHGGVTYALADSTFAFACNSRNQRTVAQQNTMTYVAPAWAGDVLTARAREVSAAGRSGIYDVTVTRDDGAVVAEFRGVSRAIKGQVFEEGPAT